MRSLTYFYAIALIFSRIYRQKANREQYNKAKFNCKHIPGCG